MSLENWPPIDGRYKLGNKNSPIAVCTIASIDEINIDLNKVAIIGKCVTENVGIEKIIQNVVSNPNIRYLILCGRESKGHFVAQAIESIKENGIAEDGRIIGAKGNMPYLRNIDKEVIARFREQVIPINLIGETDSLKIEKVIDEILNTKPSEFKAKEIKIQSVPEINAIEAGWVPDPNGYFLINIDKTRKKIIAEHYQNGKINKRIAGNSAKEVCDTVAKLNLIGDFEQKLEHLMYLGRELEKAEISLKNNLDYEQDGELNKKTVDQYSFFD
jgi:tetrahydromethanopterin S-methyltransferase subunit A